MNWDVARLQRWHWLRVAAMNRKERPRGTHAAEDGVVVAHGRFAAENHTIGRERTRQTRRNLLDVASGLPVSSVAREDDAPRVAEPRASPELHDFALWQRHDRTGPRRQEDPIPVPARRAPIVRRATVGRCPASPMDTAGEPSVLRRNTVEFPGAFGRSTHRRRSASGRRVTIRWRTTPPATPDRAPSFLRAPDRPR